jgi:hypothetical protein
VDVHLYAYSTQDSPAKASATLKLALAGLIADLMDKGWTFDSTTIDEEPVNLHTPEGVAEAQAAADEVAAVEAPPEEPPPPAEEPAPV